MSYKIPANYAVPVLASAPLVEVGEGDFAYNGMRGLGLVLIDAKAGNPADAGPQIPGAILADRNANAAPAAPTYAEKVKKALPWIAGALGVGVAVKIALR